MFKENVTEEVPKEVKYEENTVEEVFEEVTSKENIIEEAPGDINSEENIIEEVPEVVTSEEIVVQNDVNNINTNIDHMFDFDLDDILKIPEAQRKLNKLRTLVDVHLDVIEKMQRDEWKKNKRDFLYICLKEINKLSEDTLMKFYGSDSNKSANDNDTVMVIKILKDKWGTGRIVDTIANSLNKSYNSLYHNLYIEMEKDLLINKTETFNKWSKQHWNKLDNWKEEKWFKLFKRDLKIDMRNTYESDQNDEENNEESMNELSDELIKNNTSDNMRNEQKTLEKNKKYSNLSKDLGLIEKQKIIWKSWIVKNVNNIENWFDEMWFKNVVNELKEKNDVSNVLQENASEASVENYISDVEDSKDMTNSINDSEKSKIVASSSKTTNEEYIILSRKDLIYNIIVMVHMMVLDQFKYDELKYAKKRFLNRSIDKFIKEKKIKDKETVLDYYIDDIIKRIVEDTSHVNNIKEKAIDHYTSHDWFRLLRQGNKAQNSISQEVDILTEKYKKLISEEDNKKENNNNNDDEVKPELKDNIKCEENVSFNILRRSNKKDQLPLEEKKNKNGDLNNTLTESDGKKININEAIEESKNGNEDKNSGNMEKSRKPRDRRTERKEKDQDLRVQLLQDYENIFEQIQNMENQNKDKNKKETKNILKTSIDLDKNLLREYKNEKNIINQSEKEFSNNIFNRKYMDNYFYMGTKKFYSIKYLKNS
ncbi:hypothetical protein PFBG_03675 [Plasmodium falciparum 7G8]|uniref:Uncharacterized protein n=1 Tax=Plasmodium falciparum (isolate 7G8) TaxID=57266 RepID=W7F583_PLAF8|nr:hypothetical protein PFBG_03675 [Plasmodium falciparum 7G8]